MSDFLDIHALADGELGAEERKAAEERLAGDPAANAEYQAVLSLKSTLRERLPEVDYADAWESARDRLSEVERAKAAERFVGKYAWAMCASIFAVIVGAGLMNFSKGRTVSTGEVARISAGLPLSRSVPQPQDMGSWIKDVSQGAPVSLDPGHLKVIEYAAGIDEDRYVSIFKCEDGFGPVSLIIVKGANEVSGGEPVGEHSQYMAGTVQMANCLSWSDSGFAFLLIGNRSHEELRRLAEGIRLRR